eukprot:scaffold39879_cov191-Amphora_coffeaeformis.AAC.1
MVRLPGANSLREIRITLVAVKKHHGMDLQMARFHDTGMMQDVQNIFAGNFSCDTVFAQLFQVVQQIRVRSKVKFDALFKRQPW